MTHRQTRSSLPDSAMPHRVRQAFSYRDQEVALLTQHGKERVLATVLNAAVGCRVKRVDGYDTDLLGTFTRDIPRAGTQLDAARTKARLGMKLSGLPVGLASEGAFGPDPMIGLFPWNTEVLIWVDDRQGLEVVGIAQDKAKHGHLLAHEWTAAAAFAEHCGFPEHQLVVRPDSQDDPRIRKGIGSWADLETAFAWACQDSSNGQVFLETDVRAHANPTRMENIRRAAEDLAGKLCSPCPECGAPGFWRVQRVPGLPCECCGAPTDEAQADVMGCVKCTHRVTHQRSDRTTADAARCDYCNP